MCLLHTAYLTALPLGLELKVLKLDPVLSGDINLNVTTNNGYHRYITGSDIL